MARNRPDPHKKRTREHVIADLSTVHVENVVLDAGFVVERVEHDYGFDLIVYTSDEEGYVEEGEVYVQLKATDSLPSTNRGVTHRIDVRGFNLWTKSTWPVFLVVFDATDVVGYWLYVQNYFAADSSRRPKPGAKSVTVTIPQTNRLDDAFPPHLRACKATILTQLEQAKIRHE